MESVTEILDELKMIAPGLLLSDRVMPYLIPDKYFDLLAQNILNSIYFNEDCNDASELKKISKKNVYDVPQGYFETLANSILIYVKNQQEHVPSGYFEELPNIMLEKVREINVQNELNEIAPVLNIIDKKRPIYSVPEGYFESESTKIKSVFKESKKAIKSRSLMKVAVAACLVGVLTFVTFIFLNKSNNNEVAINSKIYLNSNVNIDDSLKKIDLFSMEEHLKTEELVADAEITKYTPLKDEEIDGFLNEFSDEELQKYLKENGELN